MDRQLETPTLYTAFHFRHIMVYFPFFSTTRFDVSVILHVIFYLACDIITHPVLFVFVTAYFRQLRANKCAIHDFTEAYGADFIAIIATIAQ
jgi:hypothetical protein